MIRAECASASLQNADPSERGSSAVAGVNSDDGAAKQRYDSSPDTPYRGDDRWRSGAGAEDAPRP